MSDRYGDNRGYRRSRDEYEGGYGQQGRNTYPRGEGSSSSSAPTDRWARGPPGPPQGGRGDFGGRGGPPGGGGGGGFQGGRGPPGGGRGGKKPHMGELPEIIALVKNSPNCTDASIAAVACNPPLADQQRNELVERAGDKFLPPHASWREYLKAGVELDMDAHQVYANHYLLDASALPSAIYFYNVAIFMINRQGELRAEDLSKEGREQRVNVALMKKLLTTKPDWHQNGAVGVSYDGGSTLITTKPLPLEEGRAVERVAHPEDARSNFSIGIMFIKKLDLPEKMRSRSGHEVIPGSSWSAEHKPAVAALDVALLSFARWQAGDANPQWLHSGAKIFKSGGTEFPLNDAFKAMMGYYASLKVCKSGLLLVSDISVTCFLNGGPLITVMAALGGYRTVQDMARESQDLQGREQLGLDPGKLARIRGVLKGCRVKLVHLGRSKKFKEFGPAANRPESGFKCNEETLTVAEYFARQATSGDERYSRHLGKYNGLQYPSFPTVNVGTGKNAMLVPVELISIPSGQTRQRTNDNSIASKIIKHAAMLPNDRMQQLSLVDNASLMGSLTEDSNCRAFGLNSVEHKPARLFSTILTPVKLQYANRLIEPMLTGTWNLAGNVAFAHPAPGKDERANAYPYAVVIVHTGQPRNIEGMVMDFVRRLEAESKIVNIPLARINDNVILVPSNRPDLLNTFANLKNGGAKIVVVILVVPESYGALKYAADTVNLTTQCLKLATLEKNPRGVTTNVLQKINLKMGGVNQTLAARGLNPGGKVFQSPPLSISWMFNEPCMVVGVDVNHPEIGARGPSVAAVVASMDGMLGQYACYVSACESGVEPVGTLENAFHHLLKAFAQRNQGQYPRRVIVYRDGVADNQFTEILDKEISAFKNAIMLCGLVEESLKMSIVVCQKKHHTRLVYQQNGRGEYMNPCVGLCVDTTEGVSNSGAPLHSISSPVINEFYLNSHLAVLGTSKPAKYSLIYDEIGFKNAELQLLTYWTTHLYGRCTRGVSYATPAYYAHWAARRGKVLLAAAATPQDLTKCTEQWLDPRNPNSHSTMYFI